MDNILERSFLFDAKLVNGRYDRTYMADDFARYFRAFVSSGIFMGSSTSLQVVANDDMSVIMKPGALIIDGYRYDLTADVQIPISPADGVLNRIDRISATWSRKDRDIHYTVQEGQYAVEPLAPICRRSAEYIDYVLADIRVAAGSVSVHQTDITDQRLNSEVCGLAMPFADIDTSMVFDQLQSFYEKVVKDNEVWEEGSRARFEEWFAAARDQLGEDAAGFLRKKIEELESSVKDINQTLDRCPMSSVIRRIEVVTALPGDAASHPDTLYIIAG